MKMSRFSETQIIKILREHDAGKETKDICREYGVHRATFYNWKKKYGGMDASQNHASNSACIQLQNAEK